MLNSLTLLSILFVVLVIFLLISEVIEKKHVAAESLRRRCSNLPNMRQIWFLGLGDILEVSKANKEGRLPSWYVDKFDELGKDVHTFRASALGNELIITRDPENAKALLSSQAKDFEIGPYRKAVWEPLLGNGIFTAQGDAWKHSRQLLKPQFAREQISDLALADYHVQKLLGSSALKTGSDGWTQKLDLAPLFFSMSHDLATDFLYGSRETHDIQLASRSSDFSYHIEASKSCLTTKAYFGRWGWLVYSPRLRRHCAAVHRHVDELVKSRLSCTQKISTAKPQRFVLLDELARYTQDPLELRSETLQTLNAGRDTTDALLGWIFYHLARQPRVFHKLRAIVVQRFGTDSKAVIDYQTLKSCEYLNHCISEVLRVAGVIPVNEKVSLKDTTLPTGGGSDGKQPVFVRKGQRILIINWAMQRRCDIWGEDAEEFRPERWEGRRTGFEFVPFGAGPRICLGQQFALTEAAYITLRFLQRFDGIENVDGKGRPCFAYKMSTSHSGTGVKVRLHETV